MHLVEPSEVLISVIDRDIHFFPDGKTQAAAGGKTVGIIIQPLPYAEAELILKPVFQSDIIFFQVVGRVASFGSDRNKMVRCVQGVDGSAKLEVDGKGKRFGDEFEIGTEIGYDHSDFEIAVARIIERPDIGGPPGGFLQLQILLDEFCRDPDREFIGEESAITDADSQVAGGKILGIVILVNSQGIVVVGIEDIAGVQRIGADADNTANLLQRKTSAKNS